MGKITDVKVYPENIKKLKSLIIEGTNFEYKPGEIAEAQLSSNMYAATTIGKYRENQEDAVLLAVHPKNPEFKMIVVADGMGGYEAGEEASKKTVNEINTWFESLDEQLYMQSPKEIEKLLQPKLEQINDELVQKYKTFGGTTFCGAIVLDKQTLVVNIGDSRAYIIKKGNISQVTEDQSVSWEAYKKGEIEHKSNIRFHNESNMLTEALGGSRRQTSVQYKTINNNEYDVLFLATDGVTDILSDDQLMVISKKTNRKELAKKIVEKSMTEKSGFDETSEYRDWEFELSTFPGKDNATIALIDSEEDKKKNQEER